jgi:hypothetical protein
MVNRQTIGLLLAVMVLALANWACCGSTSPSQDFSEATGTIPAAGDAVEDTLLPGLPTVAPALTPTPPDPTVDTSKCTLGASFQADITVPDNTKIEAGQPFIKTWSILNTGTCNWGPGYRLFFIEGEQMGGPESVSLPDTPAGESAEISVELVAPVAGGQHRGSWQICVNETECFGDMVYVQIISVPPPTATPIPTSTPNTAGATAWLTYKGQQVGIREIAWGYRLDYYRPEEGQIFLSVYIIGVNIGTSEETFNPLDFELVDGGGEVHSYLMFAEKEPSFHLCTVKAGGVCEGWWTTSIWDRDAVKADLTFRWVPSFWDSPIETPIIQ